MAKGKGVGISSEPPKAKNKAQYTKAERKAFKSGEVADPRQNKQPNYQGLNDDQSRIINQTNRSDYQLGDYAQGQLGNIEAAYSQPFDQSQLPQSPWSQGQSIQDMNTEYYDKALSNYDRSMEKQYKEQDADFEQQMFNRGIPLGSELYNKLRAETSKTRDSSRQNAMDSAYFNAGQNATTWNNLGTQNFQNAYGYQQDMRNMPLADYSRLMAAQSGMPLQNLGYSQAQGLAGQQNKYTLQQIKANQAGSGGGGSGGGGGNALWQQYGFSSPMEYDAYKTSQARENALWDYSNNPQYRQPKQPSPWAGAAGGILGIGVGSAIGNWLS